MLKSTSQQQLAMLKRERELLMQSSARGGGVRAETRCAVARGGEAMYTTLSDC